MPIIIYLDDVMKARGFSLAELADLVGITNVNLSRIKTGKIRALRFTTLDPLCEILGCQPGDILKHVPQGRLALPRRDALETVSCHGKEPPPEEEGGGSRPGIVVLPSSALAGPREAPSCSPKPTVRSPPRGS